MHHIVNLRAHSASYVADRIQDKKKVPKITIKKNQNYIHVIQNQVFYYENRTLSNAVRPRALKRAQNSGYFYLAEWYTTQPDGFMRSFGSWKK